MPKQTFHINRFEGGMNTDFAPEDIPDNSLLDALGISVSNIGRIVMPGDPHTVAIQKDGTQIALEESSDSAGYGLFAFNSDYFTDNSEAATQYLAMANGSHIKIWNGAAWNADYGTISGFDSDGFDMGAGETGHNGHPSFYAPNGNLRVCDGKFHHANHFDNNVKWFGYTPNKTIGTGTGDATIGGWSVEDASIEGGYPKDSSGIATNAMMMDNGSSAADDIYAYTSAASDNDWGFHFEYQPASDSSSTFAGSTWQPSVNTEYKFYTSYVYDDIQEGNPTPLKMYPTLRAYSNGADAVVSSSEIRFIDRSSDANYNYCTVSRSGTTVTVNTFDNSARDSAETHNISVGDTILIEGSDSLRGYYTVTVDNDADTFTFEHGTSGTVSAENAYYSKVGTNLAIYFSPNFKFNGGNSQDFNFGASAVGDASGGNQRITGSRVYYSSSDDGHANLWIMFDANWEKGVKAFGVGKDEPTVTDYIPWNNVDDAQDDVSVDLGDYNIWRHPPRYETYESLNGYPHNSKLDAKWKTAVIANGRAYIGNVKRRQKATFDVNDTALTSGKQAWDSTVKNDPTFSDRILKSPVDRFDTFPEEMAIELFGGDDGDSIVKLETFADRLFVFKKNILHIINIAKDVEILESSHKGMGLDGGFQCQSCLTKNGIAWINSSGAYHYNGESIESLTDNKIESFWKGKTSNHIDQGTAAGAGQRPKAFWLANAADIPSIGYDIESNKLIIHKTATQSGDDEEDILIYDMKIKAWTWLNEAMDNDENRTNMVNYDGMLIYHEDDSGDDPMFRYNDSPHPPGHSDTTVGNSLRVYTKPYDFGAPLQRKKIYKVYVTYRCEGVQGSDNVQMQYYINGDTSNLYNFTTGATNTFSIGSDDDNVHTTSSVAEFDTTAGLWDTAAFKPATSSEANNVKSFGLYIFNQSGAVDKDFEINDITIVYRTKSVK